MRRAQRAQRREEFERFVATATDPLLRTAYLVVWDLGEAEDLVQECLLRVARHWPRVRAMEHPTAYARKILINLALDGADRRRRRRGELNAVPDLDGGDPSEDTAGRLEARSELAGALRRLPPRQRAVLVLRYFHDLSEAQVAETLGCSVGTVKSTASRGLDRLRAVMDPETEIDQGVQIR
ncbi:MAG TPA: SigE family RNA polymerase sigma factor [Solirubrobacteraceae bacterium]